MLLLLQVFNSLYRQWNERCWRRVENRVVEKVQSIKLALFLIWIVPLKCPLSFLCWKMNYPLNFLCSWGPLSIFAHVDRKRQKNWYIIYYDRDISDNKTKLTWILGPSDPCLSVNFWVWSVLHKICCGNSPASVTHSSSKDVDFWLTFFYIFYHSLLSFSCYFWCKWLVEGRLVWK